MAPSRSGSGAGGGADAGAAPLAGRCCHYSSSHSCSLHHYGQHRTTR